ncbi:unnamed protein product [Gordionus sp. m RMFG-2023]
MNFFKSKGHQYVYSSSVVPLDDPTLLFTNAGMNQFKPIFLGNADPKSELGKYIRVCNTQKCIRAGGKHNDLDDVGKDVYHHTFFEMLGNWSFGDYFKKEICTWAWELLTEVYKLPKERLYVTYFGGDQESGLKPDLECRDIWLNLGIENHKVLPGSMKDNFWEMGDTGPCGPCSEIHYDRLGMVDASHLVNKDVPEVLEIWNLVFIQYNREADGKLVVLPKKHIDCGMGFERLVSVIQNKPSNYDTDLFTTIFDQIQQKLNIRPYTGKVKSEDVDGIDMAYRVIADHVRTLTIALSDGGRPDNVGRGYVLRRILRRAISLVPTVVQNLQSVFPEIANEYDTTIEIIDDEETQFIKTLSRGKKLLQSTIKNLPIGTELGLRILPGDVAWKLYDTYGFPLDLTQLMAEEQGISVDLVGYEKMKQLAVQISQNKAGGSEEKINDLNVHDMSYLRQMNIPYTNDRFKYDYQTSPVIHSNSSNLLQDATVVYKFEPITAKILAIKRFQSNTESTGHHCFIDIIGTESEANTHKGSTITNGHAPNENMRNKDYNNNVALLLDSTNFYAESGGQIYDTGFINKESGEDEAEFVVKNTQSKGGYVIHVGDLEKGCLKVGDLVKLYIDEDRRRLIMNNHTGTHVLNFALRDVLKETEQKGSLVAPDRLRFDFSVKSPLTTQQLKMLEDICRDVIDKDLSVYAQEAPLQLAKSVKGVRAIFDEAYPDPVRIVSIGIPVKDLVEQPTGNMAYKYSAEFCGGTHLFSSGHIENMVITQEESLAKGIRRIVALTGKAAHQAIQRSQKLENILNNLCNEVKDFINTSGPQPCNMIYKTNKTILDISKEINTAVIPCWKKDQFRADLKDIKKHIDTLEKAENNKILQKIIDETKVLANETGESSYIVHKFDVGNNKKALDAAIKEYQTICPDSSIMFIGVENNKDEEDVKITLMCRVPGSTVDTVGLKANEWINYLIKSMKNVKYGGKDISAQAVGFLDHIKEVATVKDLAMNFARMKMNRENF